MRRLGGEFSRGWPQEGDEVASGRAGFSGGRQDKVDVEWDAECCEGAGALEEASGCGCQKKSMRSVILFWRWGGVRHSTRSVRECDLVSSRRGRGCCEARASGGSFREHPGIVIPDVASVSCEYLGDPSVDLAAGIVEKGGCDAGDQ